MKPHQLTQPNPYTRHKRTRRNPTTTTEHHSDLYGTRLATDTRALLLLFLLLYTDVMRRGLVYLYTPDRIVYTQ